MFEEYEKDKESKNDSDGLVITGKTVSSYSLNDNGSFSFNSVEDLAKSYAELEKKLGAAKPQETPEPIQEEAKTDDLEIANKAAEAAGLNVKTCNLSLITQAN